MCGIAGYISNKKNCKDLLQKIGKQIYHRGPDNTGYHFENGYGLVHTRLTIIDPDAKANQPMFSLCGNYIIVYNGEIYNYKELREDLITKGHKFYSKSDTEVILNGFIEYRENIVSKLNGMFSFVIFDKKQNCVFLSRDRHGIKPLFYYHNETEFWFSSELNPLTIIDNEGSLDGTIMFLYLGSVPEPYTIYKNIKKFPAGSYAFFKNNKLEIRKFFNLNFSPKIEAKDDFLINAIHTLVEDAVKRSLVSDVPIGTFLSGGLDSSIISIIASKYVSKLKTVSVTFDAPQFSEKNYQQSVYRKINSDHYELNVDKSKFNELFRQYICILEQPNIDGFNTYIVSKAAKDHGLKTILAGQGGDELFFGYNSFQRAKKLRERFIPTLFYLIRTFLNKKSKTSNSYKNNRMFLSMPEASIYFLNRYIFSPEEIALLLDIKITEVEKVLKSMIRLFLPSSIKLLDDQISYWELQLYLAGQLLPKDDMYSMFHSLEIRIPLLDNDLVDFVLKIDPRKKYNASINKFLLAKAFENDLPKEIIYRPKSGFSIPYSLWLGETLNEVSNLDNHFISLFQEKKIGWTKIMALIQLLKLNKNLRLEKILL